MAVAIGDGTAQADVVAGQDLAGVGTDDFGVALGGSDAVPGVVFELIDPVVFIDFSVVGIDTGRELGQRGLISPIPGAVIGNPLVALRTVDRNRQARIEVDGGATAGRFHWRRARRRHLVLRKYRRIPLVVDLRRANGDEVAVSGASLAIHRRDDAALAILVRMDDTAITILAAADA